MANVVTGEKRNGSISIRSSGGVPIIDETYVFTVKSDNKNNSRFEIMRTPDLPVVGVSKSSYGLTVCRSKTAERDEKNPLYWDVTCTFSSEVEEGQQNNDPEAPPTEWVPIYETKFERQQLVVVKDFAGNPIANSAGQSFPTGLTISRFLPVWEFFQFESATVSDETIIGRNEVVNSDTFRGRAANTLLCTVMSSVIGFYYGQFLRFTRYSLKYNPSNWKHKRLDVGTIYLSGGDKLPYLDDGTPPNVIDGPLNGSGAKAATPAIREFEMYPTMAFNSFLRF
jgi:hypothetical protein